MTLLTSPAPDVGLTHGPARGDWYDDRCSCLQVDVAHAVAARGWNPVQALGTGWRYFAAEQVETAEYFHPRGHKLREAMLLYHPARLEWRFPSDPEAAHQDLLEALSSGLHPIVAVDNFHLPFRPAFGDVHAAHSVLVLGYEPAADSYLVHDPMPPAYRGPVSRRMLDRARTSDAASRDGDRFFAGSAPARRWLRVEVFGPQPTLHWAWLAESIQLNLAALRGDDPERGLAALRALLDRLPEQVADRGADRLRELYVLGWPAQAEAGLHAEFIRQAATRLDRPRLAEAARCVDLVASSWTGLRVTAAHAAAGPQPSAATSRILRLGHDLVDRWEAALRRFDGVVEQP